MTTPRDDIAGLLRQRGTWSDGGKVWDQDALCAAAATQLDSLLKERDSLQARVKELESGIAHAQYRSDNCDAENQSLYNRLEAVESRATRIQQERDEAYERLKPFAKGWWSHQNPKVKISAIFNHNPFDERVLCTVGEMQAAYSLVRRLAGPEKPAANDGEERSSPPEGKI